MVVEKSDKKNTSITVQLTDKEKGLKDTSKSHDGAELQANFSMWSVLGVGFGLTNSWLGISSSLITGIQSGGPMLIIYGILIVASVSYGIGITLSELSSAIPSAGGQYVWTRVLAPRKHSGLLSYLCGSLAWVGALFSSAALTLSISLAILGFWNLTHPEHVTKSWELFVIFQITNVSLVLFNCYHKYLPFIANGALYVSLFSYVAITITVLACAKGNYQSAEFVFVKFENSTGWKSTAVAFIVGLVNPNFSFAGLDAATHLAEEVQNAERVIPIAILGTVTIGLFTALTYAIAMFFSVRNLSDIIEHGTGLPILDIFYQALNNKAGAICLGTLILISLFLCTITAHTWQARLCWSFSRDNGLPFSKALSTIDPKLGVPLNAHFTSASIVAILGCLYLASSTAFNSMVIGCVTFLLLSYLIPTICLLYRGRSNIKHGCFWLGNFGLVANFVTIGWTLFALGLYSLPSFMPVTAGSMNYVSVVYVVYLILALGYWFFPMKKYACRFRFAGGLDNNEEEEFSYVCHTKL